MKLTYSRTAKSLLLASVAMAAIACNGEKDTSADANATAQTQTAEVKRTEPESAQSKKKARPYELTTSPIPVGWINGDIEPVTTVPGPCPFLSDEGALGGVKKTSFALKRSTISNEKCSWTKNAGMFISATVEPLTDAKPNEDRAYNLDTPPVLKDQSGPGENAVILYDTAWDEERPYSMSFDQNDKRINIWVSGLGTDEAKLRAVADEISEKLPNAPTVTEQRPETVSGFDACSIWSEKSLRALFDLREDGSIKPSLEYSGCRWNIGSDSSGEFRLSVETFENRDIASEYNADKIQTVTLSLANGQTTTGKYYLGEPDRRTGNQWSQMSVPIGDKYANMYFTLATPEQEQATKNLMQNFASRVQ